MTKGKVIFRVFIALIFAVLIWLAASAALILCSDKVMIFGYTGLENLFHPKYGSHAVVGSVHVPVPMNIVKLLCPENENDYYDLDPNKRDVYRVKLCYNKDGTPIYQDENVIEHSHDSTYIIEYNKSGDVSHQLDIPSEEVRAAMLDITEQLFDMTNKYDPEHDKWSGYSGGQNGGAGPTADSLVTIESFELVLFDNGMLADTNDAIYSYHDGKLDKIMDIPEEATFNYCIWRR